DDSPPTTAQDAATSDKAGPGLAEAEWSGPAPAPPDGGDTTPVGSPPPGRAPAPPPVADGGGPPAEAAQPPEVGKAPPGGGERVGAEHVSTGDFEGLFGDLGPPGGPLWEYILNWINPWPQDSHSDANALGDAWMDAANARSEEHTSELQSRENLVCRLLLEKKNEDTKVDIK